MINKVILVGRITRDPELRHTSNGIPFVQFTLAVNRPYQNRDGNRDADFINCTAWRTQAENLSRFIRKGALLGIEGSIQVSNYDDQQGMRRTMTTVVCDAVTFLEPRGSQQRSDYQYQDYSQPIPQQYGGQTPYSGGYDNRPRQNQYENPFSELDRFNDLQPSDFENEPTKKEKAFEDVGNYDISNDDLPF